MPGREVQVKVWEARIGRVRLVLLDTDLPANSPSDRDIAHRLYGGDRQTRIEQEIVLGVGGVRALAALRAVAHRVAHQRRARGLSRARSAYAGWWTRASTSPAPSRRRR
ncbi:MAG: hypothetical protein M5U30_18775 [Burkholderiaceae bacterium]|nr:hypothetical protein [Burkholderiaceae bacterium]